jgi:hypothetical protein
MGPAGRVIFKITPTGTLTVLDSQGGGSALVQGADGDFYGSILLKGRTFFSGCY